MRSKLHRFQVLIATWAKPKIVPKMTNSIRFNLLTLTPLCQPDYVPPFALIARQELMRMC